MSIYKSLSSTFSGAVGYFLAPERMHQMSLKYKKFLPLDAMHVKVSTESIAALPLNDNAIFCTPMIMRLSPKIRPDCILLFLNFRPIIKITFYINQYICRDHTANSVIDDSIVIKY